jgi:repressor LexA
MSSAFSKMSDSQKTIGGRLLEAFADKQIRSKSAIAAALGFKSDKSIYKIINGEQELSFDGLRRFSEKTGRSIDWLLTGRENDAIEPGQVPIYFGAYEQQMMQDLAKANNRTFQEQIRDIVLEEMKRRGMSDVPEESNVLFFGEPVRSVTVPLMGWIAAGEPIHIVAEQQDVNVPDFFMKPGKQYFVLHVRGDSMIGDQIVDGSLIVCESRQTAIDGEKVVAVIDGEKATVKRIYHEGDRVRLQPANPLHKPIYVEPNQRLDIQGVVVGIFHKPA